eukprot:COSAG01_NODE_3427_length_6093_cov_9.704943_3_plen_189_part_00
MSTPPRARPERTVRLTASADSSCPGRSWPRGLSAGCFSDPCAVHRRHPPHPTARATSAHEYAATRAARAHGPAHRYSRFGMFWLKLAPRLVSWLLYRSLRRPPRHPPHPTARAAAAHEYAATRAARAHGPTHSQRRFGMPWPKLSGSTLSPKLFRYLRRPSRRAHTHSHQCVPRMAQRAKVTTARTGW